MLYAGLGPALYLTSDGRVLVDNYIDDEELREADDAEALSAIVVGAKTTGVRELLDLLPDRTRAAVDCKRCDATGWWLVPGSTDVVTGEPGTMVCPDCHGLGWCAQAKPD